MTPRSHTLLERLALASSDAGRTIRLDGGALAESVVEHLKKMLNTRQGEGLTVPDYGIPALADVRQNHPDSIVQLQHAIQDSIERYEPRLRDVSVKYIPYEEDPFQIRFEVNARLVSEGQQFPFRAETMLDASGRASVRR
jgi:type VI secretion system protein